MTSDLQSATLKAILRTIGNLPFLLLQCLGACVGTIAALLPLKFNRVAQINIRLCFPHLSRKEQLLLARRSIRNTFITAFEQTALWCAPIYSLVPQIAGTLENENLAQAALAKGKGLILLAPHLSSWEISQAYVSGRFKFSAVYKPIRKKALDAFIFKSRQRAGMKLLPTSASGLRQIYRALANNELVCILPDQVPGEGSGVYAPFFGNPALTMTLIHKLVQRTEASVLIGACYRRGIGKGFDLVVYPVDDAIANQDPIISATAMNHAIEQVVQRAPEQYHWIYKRFKKQPDGKKIYS